MGHIDQFVWAQVTPQLFPGEQILHTGFVRQPRKINALGVVGEYGESWNLAATNLRLILLETESSGLWNAVPKPICKQVVVWWYQELREVTVGRATSSSSVFFGLAPHETFGPYGGSGKRYDAAPTTEGVDGQAAFYNQFAPWLQQQVAAGAFPMDAERHARLQQLHAERHAAAEAERQRSAEAAQRRQEALAKGVTAARGLVPHLRWLLPGAIILAGLGGIGVGGFVAYDATSGLERSRAYSVRLADDIETLERAVKRERARGVPRDGGSAAELASQRRRADAEVEKRETREEDRVYGFAGAVAGLVVTLVGVGVLVAMLRRRKRELAAPG